MQTLVGDGKYQAFGKFIISKIRGCRVTEWELCDKSRDDPWKDPDAGMILIKGSLILKSGGTAEVNLKMKDGQVLRRQLMKLLEATTKEEGE